MVTLARLRGEGRGEGKPSRQEGPRRCEARMKVRLNMDELCGAHARLHKFVFTYSRSPIRWLQMLRQEPIDGRYFEFGCHERRLIIELEGSQHLA